MRIKAFAIALATALMVTSAAPVMAQEGPGGLINPGRDCQTVTNCRFAKGGRFRGCVSSFSCRVCRFVTSRCKIGAKSGKCRRLRCSWGS